MTRQRQRALDLLFTGEPDSCFDPRQDGELRFSPNKDNAFDERDCGFVPDKGLLAGCRRRSHGRERKFSRPRVSKLWPRRPLCYDPAAGK